MRAPRHGQGASLVGGWGRAVGPEDRIDAAARTLQEAACDPIVTWDELTDDIRDTYRSYIEALDDAGLIGGGAS